MMYFNGPPPSKLGFVAKPEMPPYINILFRARPPLDYVEPIQKEHLPKYDFVHSDNLDLDKVFEDGHPPERVCGETPEETRERVWREKVIENYLKIKEQRKNYDPKGEKGLTQDPYKTMFVSRLNFQTDEDTLRKEMERIGPVANLRLVTDKKSGKSRGYAFVEFKHSRHCDRLYDMSGMKIDGKRILVDYELGRTNKDWLPKRLGGGKGTKRRDRDNERKIRKVIKDYRRTHRSSSRSKISESKRSESKPVESRKRDDSKSETPRAHKRQKVSEVEEMERKMSRESSRKESHKNVSFLHLKEPIGPSKILTYSDLIGRQ